jgi:hypothetical protein
MFATVAKFDGMRHYGGMGRSVIPMTVIKIPKQYLVEQDEASITVDVPEVVLAQWQERAETVNRVRDRQATLALTKKDLEDAINWARQGAK